MEIVLNDEESPSAGAYYSQDFEWEALRKEVESMFELSNGDGNSKTESDGMQEPSLKRNMAQTQPTKKVVETALRNTREGPVTSIPWEAFHTRHERNVFFKERRYLTKEFPDLLRADKALCVLEVGCGTGSSVVPILRANREAVVYACDCSAAALKKAAEVVSTIREPPPSSSFYPFLCDISLEKLPSFLCCSVCRGQHRWPKKIGTEPWVSITSIRLHDQIDSGEFTDGVEHDAPKSKNSDSSFSGPSFVGCCVGGLDMITMIFTLSAIPVEKMAHVLGECLTVLKPGGLLLFRDYGLYDMTMLRFAPGQWRSDRLYQREDGTLAYFFSLEMVRELFTEAGLEERELEYCCVQLTNRRKQVPMKRVWVHAKFQKPES